MTRSLAPILLLCSLAASARADDAVPTPEVAPSPTTTELPVTTPATLKPAPTATPTTVTDAAAATTTETPAATTTEAPAATTTGTPAAATTETPAATTTETPAATTTAEPTPVTPTIDPKKPVVAEQGIVLTVMGRRRDEGRIVGSAQVVGETELKVFAHDDVQKTLKAVPGVYVREEDGFGLRPNIGLRGASSDRSSKVTLMEDGVLFGPAPYAAPAAYYFPMMARAASLEVFKGPASVRSGPQTIGGALNMVTRPVPESLTASMDVGAGMFGTARAHGVVGTGNEHFGVLLEGVRLQTDGFKQLDGGGPTGFTKDEVMLKSRAVFGDAVKHAFELKLGWSDETSHETYTGLSDETFRATPLRRLAGTQLDVMRWWRTQAQLSHVLTIGEEFTLRTVAYRNDMHRRWDRLDGFRGGTDLAAVLANPTGGNAVYESVLSGASDSEGNDQQLLLAGNDRTFVSQGVQSVGFWRFETGAAKHGLHFGARVHADSIRRVHDATSWDMRSGRLLRSSDPTVITAQNTGAVQALALHALDELDLGPLTLAPGVRFELIRTAFIDDLTSTQQETVSPAVLPGFGAAWQFDKQFSALLGVHRGFSPVSPGQTADTKPEESVNAELGGRFRSKKYRAEVVGFYNRYSNIVGNCTGSSGCPDAATGAQFNGGAANVGGAEVSGGVREKVLGQTVTADVSYTLTVARFAGSFRSAFPQFGNVREGDELPYVPMHQGALSLGVEGEQFRVALSGNFVSAMRDHAGQGDARANELTDAQLLLDVAGQLRLAPGAWLTLKATNLTNAAYVVSRRPYGARPNQPMTAMVGFRWELGGE